MTSRWPQTLRLARGGLRVLLKHPFVACLRRVRSDFAFARGGCKHKVCARSLLNTRCWQLVSLNEQASKKKSRTEIEQQASFSAQQRIYRDICPSDRTCGRARRCMLIRVTCSHVCAVGVGSDATEGNNQADFAEEGAVVWQRGVRPAPLSTAVVCHKAMKTSFAHERLIF